MVLASRKSVDATTLRWSELVPGRLLHVRCAFEGATYDVLNVYQKVRTAGSEQDAQRCLQERAKVWRKLDQWVGGIPYRDAILIAGDFNTSLPRKAGLTGNSADQQGAPSAYAAEAHAVADMLARQGLVACNTFGKRQGTFVHSKGESLIDYAMTRRGTADAEARRARPADTPLASWRNGGHRVLVGSLTMRWRPWQKSQATGRPRQAEQATDAASGEISAVRKLAERTTVENRRRIQMPQLENLESAMAKYWEHRALFRKAGTRSLRQCFELLRQYWLMMTIHRMIRRRARRRQRLRRLELLSTAEAAAEKGMRDLCFDASSYSLA